MVGYLTSRNTIRIKLTEREHNQDLDQVHWSIDMDDERVFIANCCL